MSKFSQASDHGLTVSSRPIDDYNQGMRHLSKIAGVLLVVAIAGCGGRQATPESVGAAQARWKALGVRDYDLEWTNSGQGAGHYRVFVRDGEVKAIYSILPNGREIVAKPGRPEFYSVDGLFATIKDELAQVTTAAPFGRPKGTSAILRFTPDADLGYPKRYTRDVLGTPKGVVIDVLRLDRAPTLAVPKPNPGPEPTSFR